MRRGLIARSPEELPDAVLDARLARLRAGIDAARLDALIVYTNNTRPAGVSWVTGFVPYWSEALRVLLRRASLRGRVGIGDDRAGDRERCTAVGDALPGGAKPRRRGDPQSAHRARGGAPHRRGQGRCRRGHRRRRPPLRRDFRRSSPGRAAPRPARRGHALRAGARQRRSGRDRARSQGRSDRTSRACADSTRRHRPRQDARRGRGIGAPARRRGNLSRGGARSRPRSPPAPHRRRGCGRPQLRGACERRLQGQLGAA